MHAKQAISILCLASSLALLSNNTNTISALPFKPIREVTQNDLAAMQPYAELDMQDEQDGQTEDTVTKQQEKETPTHTQNATQEVNNLEKVPQNNQPTIAKTEDATEKEIVQRLLLNFANVIGNFFNIVAAPNDPQVVGNSISNMLGGMINIAAEAFKRGDLKLDADQETIKQFTQNLSKKLKTTVSRMIVARARSIH